MTGICESEDRTWLDIIDLDLVPRVIENGGRLYLGFVHDGEENPPKYYEFILPSVKLGTLEVRGTEPKMPKDSVHKISPFSYSYMSQMLRDNKVRYNLKKNCYAFNRNNRVFQIP